MTNQVAKISLLKRLLAFIVVGFILIGTTITFSVSNHNHALSVSANSNLVLLDYIASENKANFTYRIVNKPQPFFVKSKTVDITLDGKTFTYPCYRIGEVIVVDSNLLVGDFGFAQSLVTHQAGDPFSSLEHSVLAWSLRYYALSKNENLEYGTLFYVNGDGFSFSTLIKGTHNSISLPGFIYGKKVVAGIHTHPISNSFSKYNLDDEGNVVSGDRAWIDCTDIPLYLATPNGSIKVLTKYYDYRESSNFSERTVFYGIKWE